MNPNPSNSLHAFECPTHDRALFDGHFSGRMRELALGSSRCDALSAIRTSKLTDWVVDGKKASIAHSGVSLVFNGQDSSSSQWVTGSTPHGEFALPRDHWIAKQLLKRFDRRTSAFKAELEPVASRLSDSLLHEALLGEPRSWKRLPEGTFGPKPMKPSSTDRDYGTRNFVRRTTATTELGDGFYAELHNLTYFGVHTHEEAFSDFARYRRDLQSTSVLPRVRPPLQAGRYTDEYIGIYIHYHPLDSLRSVVGQDRKPVHTDGFITDPERVKRIWINSKLG